MNLQEAIANQIIMHQEVEDGRRKHLPIDWRTHSLHPNYEFKPVHDYGIGYFPVNKITGEVCECKMQWFENGKILICPVCFLEGT